MTALNKKRLFPREAEALRGRTAQCAREGHVPPPPPRVPRSCRPFQVGLTGRCLHPAGGTDACDSEESDVPQSGMERCPPRKPGSEKTAEHHHRPKPQTEPDNAATASLPEGRTAAFRHLRNRGKLSLPGKRTVGTSPYSIR